MLLCEIDVVEKLRHTALFVDLLIKGRMGSELSALLLHLLLCPQVGFDLTWLLNLSGLPITLSFLFISTFLDCFDSLADHLWFLVLLYRLIDMVFTLTRRQVSGVLGCRLAYMLCAILEADLLLESVLKTGLMRRLFHF